jgi:hypothetical protein
MNTAPHKYLGLGLLVLVTLAPSTGQSAQADVPAPSPAAVVMRGGTPEEEELLGWAIGRYETAGLVLPPIVIRFHADQTVCGDLDGFIGWDGETFVIETCRAAGRALQHNLLHEMAHAWDLGGGLTDEARGRFLGLRGLRAWHELTDDWSRRGAEQMAEILAWGLDAAPSRIPTRVADVGPQNDASLTTAFETLTGRLPLWSA